MNWKNNKSIKIIGVIVLVLFLASEYQNINYRLGNYPCAKVYEQLSFPEKIVAFISGYEFQTQSEQLKEADAARKKQCDFSDSELSDMRKNPQNYIGKTLDVRLQIFLDDCKKYSVSEDSSFFAKMPHEDLLGLVVNIPKDSDAGKRLSQYGLKADNSIKTEDELHVTGKIKSIEGLMIRLEKDTTKIEIVRYNQ